MTFLREGAATGLFFHPLCRATMHLVTIGGSVLSRVPGLTLT